jgi:hypothetical protein
MTGVPTIPDGPSGQRVREYFRKLRINPNKPADWYICVEKLIDQLEKREKAGAPLEWTDKSLLGVWWAVERMRHETGLKNTSEIFRRLAKKKGISVHIIRDRFYEANGNRGLVSIAKNLMALELAGKAAPDRPVRK